MLIYESGPIGAKPSVLPLSIGDGELAETAGTVVPTAEIFPGRLAQLDEVLLGCANQAGEDNRNVARMALLLAGRKACRA